MSTGTASLEADPEQRLLGAAGVEERSEIDGYVCFSAQDWWYFNRGHSDFQLMTRVARSRPVLLVNSLGMRMPAPGRTSAPWHRIGRKVRSALRGLRTPVADLPDFKVFTPLFLPVYGAGRLATVNQLIVRWQVRWVARRIGIRHPAVVVTLPTAWPVARQLDRARTVAYRSDRYSALPEADAELVAGLERDLLRAADVAFFSSAALLEAEQGLTRRPLLLSHGIDLDTFRPAHELQPHECLASIPSPRIGYVGMIDDYTVDLELLIALARSRPDVPLVLAGPVDSDIDRLLALPNAHHVGVLPLGEVPRFLAGLDVALMPWQRNEWIRHCSPVKLKEYLAAGLPVVSVDFPEVRRYQHVVDVAEDTPQFLAMVDAALAGGASRSSVERRASVSQETWDVQAARLMTMTEQIPAPSRYGGC